MEGLVVAQPPEDPPCNDNIIEGAVDRSTGEGGCGESGGFDTDDVVR